MIYYAAIPLTLFVVVLQVAAAPSFRIFGVHADLLVVWLGCWAGIRPRRETLVLLPLAGILLGLLGHEPIGASLLALLPVAGLALLYDVRLAHNRFLLALLIVLIAGMFYATIQAYAAILGGESLGALLDPLKIAPRAGMLDAVTAALWYWPMRLLLARRSRGMEFRRL